MAAAAVVVDKGRLSAGNGWTSIRMDTASGAAEVQAEIADGRAIRAKWLTAPPRVLLGEQAIACSNGGTKTVSLVTAGLPYIVITEDDLGVSLEDEAGLGPASAALGADVDAAYPLSLFGIENQYSRYLVMVTAEAPANRIRTVWVSDKGEVARSAGGTGALSVVAASRARGILDGARPTLVSAPGGSFLCEISEDRASVTAETRISARHEFIPLGCRSAWLYSLAVPSP